MNTHANRSESEIQEDKRIACEMFPFLFYAAIPVLIIVFIALKWGPSY